MSRGEGDDGGVTVHDTSRPSLNICVKPPDICDEEPQSFNICNCDKSGFIHFFRRPWDNFQSSVWLNRYFKTTHDVYRTLTEWFPSLNLTSIKKFQHICRIAQPAFIHWVDKIQHHYGCKSRSRARELFDSRLLENPVVVIKYHRSIIHIFSTDRRISLKVIVHLNQILPPRVIQHIIFNSLFC